MSGFSADWLALREGADRRAANRGVLAAVRRWAGHRARAADSLAVVDLGAGTGNTLRRLAPLLPPRQSWLLVDADAALLDWASPGRHPAGRGLRIDTAVRDLADARALAACMGAADLVIASALLDLASRSWCRALLHSLGRDGCPLYAPISYDGRIALEPADPFDETVRALVNAHQGRDKGFGPALGPVAAATLVRLAVAEGAIVCAGRSDWRLEAPDDGLIAPLLRGWLEAAGEMAPDLRPAAGAWLERRARQLAAGTLRARVGHIDVFIRRRGDQRCMGASRSHASRTSVPRG